MRGGFCQSCLASILKFLNFLQAFVGVVIVIYSVWVLDQWHKRDDLNQLRDNLDLPDEWFVYCMMGIGVVMCLFSFTGFVSAEVVNGCCLCFYALLSSLLLVLEASLVGFIILDKHWEQDIPNDPTGELGSLRRFFEANLDTLKWVGLGLVVIQTLYVSLGVYDSEVTTALSLLLAIILRAMVSSGSSDFDSDDDGDCPATRPLLYSRYAPVQV